MLPISLKHSLNYNGLCLYCSVTVIHQLSADSLIPSLPTSAGFAARMSPGSPHAATSLTATLIIRLCFPPPAAALSAVLFAFFAKFAFSVIRIWALVFSSALLPAAYTASSNLYFSIRFASTVFFVLLTFFPIRPAAVLLRLSRTSTFKSSFSIAN